MAPKVDVPRPKEFRGNRSMKEVGNFIFWCYRMQEIQEENTKVRTAAMFPIHNAMLWRCCRCNKIKRGADPIDTWMISSKNFGTNSSPSSPNTRPVENFAGSSKKVWFENMSISSPSVVGRSKYLEGSYHDQISWNSPNPTPPKPRMKGKVRESGEEREENAH